MEEITLLKSALNGIKPGTEAFLSSPMNAGRAVIVEAFQRSINTLRLRLYTEC
jgi:hypothetical protein